MHPVGTGDADFVYFEIQYPIEGSSTDLANYLIKDGNFWKYLDFRVGVPYYTHSAPYCIDYVSITIDYESNDFSPFSAQITTNGASSITTAVDVNAGGVIADDTWKIGPSLSEIALNIFNASGIAVIIDASITGYIAKDYTAYTALQVVQEICQIFGAEWFEEFTDDGLTVLHICKAADFDASGISLTSANYKNMKIERPFNQYKEFWEYGAKGLTWFAVDHDATNTSTLIKREVGATLNTITDVKNAAESGLAKLKTMRPAISFTVDGAGFEAIRPGFTVNLECERPTIAAADYPVRRVDWKQAHPNGILRADVYLGLGQTPEDEHLANTIRNNKQMAEKDLLHYISVDTDEGKPLYSHHELSNKNGEADFQHLTATQVSALHARQHAITSTSDHTSTATSGKMLKADANGLPVDATNTDAQVAATVTASHAAITVNAPISLTGQDIKLVNNAAATVTTISNDGTLAGNSDVYVPTQKAVKTYADTKTTLATVLTQKLDDFAAPDDNTDLNASTSKHGLLKKLDNVATNFMNGQGNWAAPASSENIIAPCFPFNAYNGFAAGGDGVYYVNTTDADAYVMTNFYVGTGGSFKVAILYRITAAETVSGLLYLGDPVDGDADSFDLANGVNCDLDEAVGNKMRVYLSAAYTIANNAIVRFKWAKDAAGAGNIIVMYGAVLVRQ
jgi:hypothetical protein